MIFLVQMKQAVLLPVFNCWRDEIVLCAKVDGGTAKWQLDIAVDGRLRQVLVDISNP